MSQDQILVVIGSLRRDSFNRKLANAITALVDASSSCHSSRRESTTCRFTTRMTTRSKPIPSSV
jgi:hypothetical protein